MMRFPDLARALLAIRAYNSLVRCGSCPGTARGRRPW